jgi:hypothetical protein
VTCRRWDGKACCNRTGSPTTKCTIVVVLGKEWDGQVDWELGTAYSHSMGVVNPLSPFDSIDLVLSFRRGFRDALPTVERGERKVASGVLVVVPVRMW